MNFLTNIALTNDKIPTNLLSEYKIEDIKKYFDSINIKDVTNIHVLNLSSMVNRIIDSNHTKQVTSIKVGNTLPMGDLEISDDSHSYIANGTPVHNTINVPNEYPFDDFKNIYIKAYNSGVVKGVTTYRSGTMTAVLSSKENTTNGYDEEVIIDSVKMPDSADASMKILRAEGRKWYLTVVWNETKTRPQAIFVHTNHHEKTVTTHDAFDRLVQLAKEKNISTEFILDVTKKVSSDPNPTKITRILSLLLRHGVLIKNIIAVLDKVDNVFVGSFLFQIKKFLSSFIKDGEKAEGEVCQECGSNKIVYQEGCKICLSCGSSKCG